MMRVKNNWSLGFMTESVRIRKSIFSYFLLFTFYFLLSPFLLGILSTAFAQEITTDVEPPPLRIISKEETSKLEAEKDVKGHTKLAVLFMEARLKKAETFSLESQYQEMFSELGAFHGLVDRSLIFLNKHDTDSGKVLHNLKRLEISLRAFLPRLELIRRELPFRYEFYTRTLIRYVRDARTRAIEPFYDDSVVPNIRKGN